MEAVPQSEPRRLCSWLWDSHITPNNSKWLQDNLTEMDGRVKAMIKIINEDADSFAKRAEMYYKKRPELMRLVEDFYRAYRALAERYDHMNSMLRDDHVPSSTSEPPLPVSLSPQFARRAFFCPDEFDFGLSRKGLKQLVEMFQIGEAVLQELKPGDEDSISEQCSCLSADENQTEENLNQLFSSEPNDILSLKEIKQKLESRVREQHGKNDAFEQQVCQLNKQIEDLNKKSEDNKGILVIEKSNAIAEALSFSFQSAVFMNSEISSENQAREFMEKLAVKETENLQLRKLNQQFLSELNESRYELELWEDVAVSYYHDLQTCSVREALYESKASELSGMCKILEDLSVRRCIEIERMKDKISFLERKNKGHETQLAEYVSYIASIEQNQASHTAIHSTGTSKQQEVTVNDIDEIHPPNANDRSSSVLNSLSELNSGMKLQPLEIICVAESSWSAPGTPEIMDETHTKNILLNHASDQSSCSETRRGNGKIIFERLSSDAQELERLNLSVTQLKRKTQVNKKGNLTKAVQDIEDTIVQLVEVNTKLIKTIKDSSSIEQAQKTKVTRKARKEAERIGRLQLDVQKIEYLLVKLEDEKNENNIGRSRTLRSRTGIKLSDFLYSHGSGSRKQRKVHLCGCDSVDVSDPCIKKFVKQDIKFAGMQTNTCLLSPCMR